MLPRAVYHAGQFTVMTHEEIVPAGAGADMLGPMRDVTSPPERLSTVSGAHRSPPPPAPGAGPFRPASHGPAFGDRPQRADGASRLGVKSGNRIGDLYQRTPCRIQFPRADFAGSLESVLVNTAGGLTGGDVIHQSVQVDDAAAATVTTQAAEKIYRAAEGVASVTTDLAVDQGGLLEWLPQETIVFDAATLSRTTTLLLAGDARALALEWLVLGRRAHGETICTGRIADRWRVHRDGRLVWADSLRLDGDIQAVAACPSQLDGAAALATVRCAAPDLGSLRDRARAGLAAFEGAGVLGGATIVGGLMLCRVLARDGDALRPAVRRLVAELRETIHGQPVGLPRVWNC